MKTYLHHVCCLLAWLGLAYSSLAQEWSRFRGPNGTGISDAKTIPTTWTEKDFNWKVALDGTGHSSPVLWGEKIFLTSTDESQGKIIVLCVKAADGSVAWQKSFPFAPFAKHKFNSFASSTPAVNESHMYVTWSTPDRYTIMAFDHQGKTVWERNLGPFKSQHGSGTSPIIYNDKVILSNDQDGESFLIAMDSKTGATSWKTPRNSTNAGYSTPFLYQPTGQKPSLIFNSQAHGISAIDPENGTPLWEFGTAFDKRTVSSPVLASGLIIGSCGQGGGKVDYLVAVRPGDVATGKRPQLAYDLRRAAPYVPTALAYGDLLFLFDDDPGIATCLHAPSGETRWNERVGGTFFGSPVCVDGRLFCVSATGEVVVIAASDKFHLLATNPLGETCHTTPAVAGGRMYIRTVGHLFSIGGKTKVASLK
jgi:outer membrane protein assembly factor BamB